MAEAPWKRCRTNTSEPTETAERPEPPADPAATQLAALDAEGDAMQAWLDGTRRLRPSAPFAARSPSATFSQRAPLAARLKLQSARRRTLLVIHHETRKGQSRSSPNEQH